jgi:hypothetical protein
MRRSKASRRPASRRTRRTKLPRVRHSDIDVTRAEFNDVIRILAERAERLDRIDHVLEVQFRRIADLQNEIDQIKRAWERLQTNG